MSQLYKHSFIGMLLLAIVLSILSCRTSEPPKQLLNHPAPRPINSIRIGTFQCADEVTAQAVRNVFLEILARDGDVKVVREGEADVVIEGTVTMGMGNASSAAVGGGTSAFFGRGRSVGGNYVSGVTALVLRDGEVLTSTSWGQNIGEGLMSPESVAREAAERLLGRLFREGLKKR